MIEFAPDLRVAGLDRPGRGQNLNPVPLVDTNRNAGLDVLRGGSLGVDPVDRHDSGVHHHHRRRSRSRRRGRPSSTLDITDEFVIQQILAATRPTGGPSSSR